MSCLVKRYAIRNRLILTFIGEKELCIKIKTRNHDNTWKSKVHAHSILRKFPVESYQLTIYSLLLFNDPDLDLYLIVHSEHLHNLALGVMTMLLRTHNDYVGSQTCCWTVIMNIFNVFLRERRVRTPASIFKLLPTMQKTLQAWLDWLSLIDWLLLGVLKEQTYRVVEKIPHFISILTVQAVLHHSLLT